MAQRLGTRTPVSGMVGHVLAAGSVCVVLAMVIGSLISPSAAASAGLGSVTVLVVVVLGVLGTTAVLRGADGLALAGAGVVYLGQLVLLVAVIAAVRDARWLVGPAFAVAAIAQTLMTQVAMVIGYLRARHELTDSPLVPR
ncbi:MAG: hypothetical protein ACRCYX_05515 [Dermatophilaceae bacterium]